jgi:hypothetical protein
VCSKNPSILTDKKTICETGSGLSLSTHDLVLFDFRNSRMGIQCPDMILRERRRKSLDKLMLVRNLTYPTSAYLPQNSSITALVLDVLLYSTH